MSFETISYLVLGGVLVAIAISGFLGAPPPDITEQLPEPFDSVYFRQPPPWTLACVGLGLGCVFVPAGTKYVNITALIAWVLGFLLGVTRAGPRLDARKSPLFATPLPADLALPRWWERESAGGWRGIALVVAAGLIQRFAPHHDLVTLAMVTMAFYGYVEVARWAVTSLLLWGTKAKSPP